MCRCKFLLENLDFETSYHEAMQKNACLRRKSHSVECSAVDCKLIIHVWPRALRFTRDVSDVWPCGSGNQKTCYTSCKVRWGSVDLPYASGNAHRDSERVVQTSSSCIQKECLRRLATWIRNQKTCNRCRATCVTFQNSCHTSCKKVSWVQ